MKKIDHNGSITICGLTVADVRRLRAYFSQNQVPVIRTTQDSITANTIEWYPRYIVNRAFDKLTGRNLR